MYPLLPDLNLVDSQISILSYLGVAVMAGKIRFLVNVDGRLHQIVWVEEKRDKSLIIGIPDDEYVETPGEQRFSVHNTPGQAYQTIMQSLKRSNGVRRSPQKVMLNEPNQYAHVTTKRCAPLGDERMAPRIRSADVPVTIGTCHSQRHALAFSVVVSRTGHSIEHNVAFNSFHADLVLYRVSVIVNYFMAEATHPSHSIEFVTSTPTIGSEEFKELSGPTTCSASDVTDIHFNNLCFLGVGLHRSLANASSSRDARELFDRCSTVMSQSNMMYDDVVMFKLPVSLKSNTDQR